MMISLSLCSRIHTIVHQRFRSYNNFLKGFRSMKQDLENFGLRYGKVTEEVMRLVFVIE